MTAKTKTDALAQFRAGTGAYKIAETLLDADDWMSVRELAKIGGVARSAVAIVAMRLRGAGVDVKTRRTPTKGEAEYRVGGRRTAPLTAVQDPSGVAA